MDEIGGKFNFIKKTVIFKNLFLILNSIPHFFSQQYFPYTNAFSSWDLENYHLSTQFVSVQETTFLFCLVVEQRGNPVLQQHVLKVGRNCVAGYIHHQVCMKTVYYVLEIMMILEAEYLQLLSFL